jgi:hypothetical protein
MTKQKRNRDYFDTLSARGGQTHPLKSLHMNYLKENLKAMSQERRAKARLPFFSLLLKGTPV